MNSRNSFKYAVKDVVVIIDHASEFKGYWFEVAERETTVSGTNWYRATRLVSKQGKVIEVVKVGGLNYREDCLRMIGTSGNEWEGVL